MAVRCAVNAALASAVRRGSGGKGSDCDGEEGAVAVLDILLDIVLDILATNTAENVRERQGRWVKQGTPPHTLPGSCTRIVPSRSAILCISHFNRQWPHSRRCLTQLPDSKYRPANISPYSSRSLPKTSYYTSLFHHCQPYSQGQQYIESAHPDSQRVTTTTQENAKSFIGLLDSLATSQGTQYPPD